MAYQLQNFSKLLPGISPLESRSKLVLFLCLIAKRIHKLPYLAVFALMFLLGGCEFIDDFIGKEPDKKGEIIYVESNIPLNGQNSILAYMRSEDGKLTALSGSPFMTGGKGVGNPAQILGPNDSDNPILISHDKKYLFAVNSGSNTIAVFTIDKKGKLMPLSGSPFPSGGINPVSVGMTGNKLYVVNKNQDPAQPNDGKPNYTVFNIASNGALTPLPNSTIEVTKGSSPSFAYISQNNKLLFGTDFLAFQATPLVGTLRAFSINTDGTLKVSPGSPMAIPGMGGALGLAEHPNKSVLYVGFPMQAKVGVYTFDPYSGKLDFKTTTEAGAAACWIRINKNGDRMYTLNSAEATISVHDVMSPEAPIGLQKFALKEPGPLYDAGVGMFASSQPFYLAISPNGKYLNVVSQHANPDYTNNYNYLHILKIGTDGKLSEPSEPMQLPVSATTKPQGVAVY